MMSSRELDLFKAIPLVLYLRRIQANEMYPIFEQCFGRLSTMYYNVPA